MDFTQMGSVRSVYKTKAKDKTIRIPSYTDRILWHSLPLYKNAIQPDSEYTMIETVRKSDHRPVVCSFTIADKEKTYSVHKGDLILHLSNLKVISQTEETVQTSTVCCPLLSDDTNWYQRQVFVFFGVLRIVAYALRWIYHYA